MLEVLYEAERLLPALLGDIDGWMGLFADTQRPALTRVWRHWGKNRIYLHSFGPCSQAQVFPHPHPWDSAIRIWGDYGMGIGYGSDPSMPPAIFSELALKPGSAYTLIGSNAWHWVRPKGSGTDSVMVSGPLIYPQNRVRANTAVRRLMRSEILSQLERFKRYYPFPAWRHHE